MGADLYIESVTEPLHEQYHAEWEKTIKARDAAKTDEEKDRLQKRVEELWELMYPETGYFRDSYNHTSVLWTLGLSWWKDVIPMLKDGKLQGAKLKEFRCMIAEADQHLPSKKELLAGHCTVTAKGQDSVKGWHKYYTEKRDRLLKFLDYAIQNKTSVYCSL